MDMKVQYRVQADQNNSRNESYCVICTASMHIVGCWSVNLALLPRQSWTGWVGWAWRWRYSRSQIQVSRSLRWWWAGGEGWPQMQQAAGSCPSVLRLCSCCLHPQWRRETRGHGQVATRPCSGSFRGSGAAERHCTPPHPGEGWQSLKSEKKKGRQREKTRDQGVSECT